MKDLGFSYQVAVSVHRDERTFLDDIALNQPTRTTKDTISEIVWEVFKKALDHCSP